MKTKFVLFLVIALLAAAGQAQNQCLVSDRAIDCWTRYNPVQGLPITQAQADAATQQAEAATQKTVAATNTGIPSLVSPSGSSVKDFLTLLSASVESTSLTTADGQTLTLDYNPPITILGAEDALKLQATFTPPVLNSQLTTHFASDPAALTPFDDDLTDTDNVAISATVQPTSERFGRSIAPHRTAFRAMMNAIAPDRSAWLRALGRAVVDSGLSAETQTFASLAANQQQAALQAFETAAQQQQAFLKTVGAFAGKFAELLNNQPQLYGSALYNARKNVVGPNEWTAKVTYEMARQNLNAFRKKYGATCNDAAFEAKDQAAKAAAANCATLLQNFAGQDTLADDRLTFSLEYHRTNRRWIAGDPDLQGFEFGYPRAHDFEYEVKYGRTLHGKTTGTNNGRIDLSFQYSDVVDPTDPSNDVSSRGVGSITYTLKISDSVSLPISLTYANHAADLGNVDQKLNAHFGLVYKLPTGK
jgi:hypothetical protein